MFTSFLHVTAQPKEASQLFPFVVGGNAQSPHQHTKMVPTISPNSALRKGSKGLGANISPLDDTSYEQSLAGVT